MTISNTELEELCKRKKIQLNAVVIANELINIPKTKSMNIIVNLDTMGQQGTHWVALVVRDNQAFYFDSFGAKCDNYVVEYCRRNRLNLAINVYIVQDLKSTECGLFCVALFKYLKTGKIPKGIPREFPRNRLLELCNDFINLFEPDTRENDGILYQLLK